MSYLGKSECLQCGREVDVSLNRAGMAYYRCAPCGVNVQQKSARGTRMMVEKTRRFEEPDDRQEPVIAAEKAPAIPRESRPIAPPVALEKPAAPIATKRAPEPVSKPIVKPSFLFNLGKS